VLKNKVEVFLFFYFILIFIFYSYTTLTNSQSFLHPDDREIWLISNNIYKNHSLTYEEPLHKYFEYKVFYTHDNVLINNIVVPNRASGIYFLTAFGLLFGENGPFFMISILGLACSVFFYLFTKNLFDKKIALLSTVLFSLSFPMINWSNMLFDNIPAFSFYITGLFFFSEILVKKK
jgi:4-amino-4-deoxy-L-arabinose transferase-like glycosyltransferase